MKRIHIFLDEKQIDFLKELPGKASEHIRRALDEYIYKVRGLNVSASRSKKEGESND